MNGAHFPSESLNSPSCVVRIATHGVHVRTGHRQIVLASHDAGIPKLGGLTRGLGRKALFTKSRIFNGQVVPGETFRRMCDMCCAVVSSNTVVSIE